MEDLSMFGAKDAPTPQNNPQSSNPQAVDTFGPQLTESTPIVEQVNSVQPGSGTSKEDLSMFGPSKEQPGIVSNFLDKNVGNPDNAPDGNKTFELSKMNSNMEALARINRVDTAIKKANYESRDYWKGMANHESDLEEDIVPDWFDGEKFTKESVTGYFNKIVRENKEQGATNGQARQAAIKAIEDAGGTMLDIKNAINTRRGLSNGQIDKHALKSTALELFKTINEGIAQPTLTAAKELELQGTILISDLADLAEANPTTAKVLGAVGGGVGNIVASAPEVKKQLNTSQADLKELAGEIEGAKQAYRETYGTSNPISDIAPYAPTAGMAMLNPSSLIALALAPMPADYALARAQGYSKKQAAAQAITYAGVAGTIGKVLKTAGNIYADAAKGGSTRVFTTIDEMPKKYRKQLRTIQHMHGYTDEDVVNMINGFKEGADNGILNMMDVIRLTDQTIGTANETNTFKLIIHNPEARNLILKDISRRADVFMENVTRDSDLYNIIKHQGNSLNARGGSSINWLEVLDEVNSKGIVLKPELRAELEYNAKVFSDYDYGYHNVIKETKVSNERNMLQKTVDLVPDMARAILIRDLNKAFHIGGITPISPVRKTVDLIMDIGTMGSKRKNVQKTIVESLKADTFNPNMLKANIKKIIPETPDSAIADLVTEASRLNRAYKHSRTEEEAQIFYRDEEARMKALEMERKQAEADAKAAELGQNSEAEQKYRQIKDENAEVKMRVMEAEAKRKRDLQAAKTMYKAKQYDLKKAQVEARKAKTAEGKKSAKDKVIKAKDAVVEAQAEIQRNEARAARAANPTANVLTGGLAGFGHTDDKGNVYFSADYDVVNGVAGALMGGMVHKKYFSAAGLRSLAVVGKIDDYIVKSAEATKKIIDDVLPGWKIRQVDVDGVFIESPDGKSELNIFLEDAPKGGKRLMLGAAHANLPSNVGQKVYFKLWDEAERTKTPYAAWSLTDMNKWRLTGNMLQYIQQRGKDAPYVLLDMNQKGVPSLFDKAPLTIKNARVVAKDFAREINLDNKKWNRNLPVLSANSSDEDIDKIANVLGPDKNYRVGLFTLDAVRELLQEAK